MAKTPSTEIVFDESDLGEVVAAMMDLRRDGIGWVNVSPEVEPGHEPPPRTITAWVFSSRGEPVPMITWTPPTEPGGKATVGIAHGAGGKALYRLDDAGLPKPAGWWRLTDHARRGLVLNTAVDTTEEVALRWAIEASHLLSPAPLTGEWQATVYRPTR